MKFKFLLFLTFSEKQFLGEQINQKKMQTFLSVKNIKILVQYNKPLVAGALHGRGTIYSDTDQNKL